MKWATRRNMKTDRAACAWLIRRFIDPQAEFHFFDADALIEEARKIDAKTFDALHADFGHVGMRCTFETMMDHYGLWGRDAALDHMSEIVNASDVKVKLYDFTILEGFGMWALAQGFAESIPDDHEKMKVVVPLYEALYQWCRKKTGAMKLSHFRASNAPK